MKPAPPDGVSGQPHKPGRRAQPECEPAKQPGSGEGGKQRRGQCKIGETVKPRAGIALAAQRPGERTIQRVARHAERIAEPEHGRKRFRYRKGDGQHETRRGNGGDEPSRRGWVDRPFRIHGNFDPLSGRMGTMRLSSASIIQLPCIEGKRVLRGGLPP